MQRRVLIADPNLDRFNETRSTLTRNGFAVFGLHSWDEIPSNHKLWPPDAIVVSADLRAHIGATKFLLDHTPLINLTENTAEWMQQLQANLAPPGQVLVFGDRTVHLHRLVVEDQDQETKLTAIEADLLAYLTMHPDRALHRAQLLQRVWGYNANVASRAVDSTVKRLRKKIEIDASNPKHLITVFGVGYRLVEYSNEAATKASPRDASPSTRTIFLGREEEWASLDQAIQSSRSLITLRGFGGAGKTTLVRAWSAKQDYSSKFFIDLSHARDKTQILISLAQATQIPLSVPVEGLLDAIRTTLRAHQSGLIVLDNCEQIRTETRDVVSDLLEETSFHWIVTSREPLGLPAEQVIPIGPLSSEMAAALFNQHAHRLGFSPIKPEDEPLVSRLVEALDRLPLAIELASGQLGVMTLSQMLDRLENQRASWSDSDRPERHRTMHATLQWSWNLLNPEEQRALAQCSVFEGGFHVSLAEQVIQSTGLVSSTELLASLQRKSLIHKSQYDRLSLLEITAEFARNQLELMGLTNETRDRHARVTSEYCTHLDESTLFNEWAPDRALTLERRNMITAFRHTSVADIKFLLFCSLDKLLLKHGPTSERPIYFQALPTIQQLSPSLRPWHTIQMVRFHWIKHRSAPSSDTLKDAVLAASEIWDDAQVKTFILKSIEFPGVFEVDYDYWLGVLKKHSDNTTNDRGIFAYWKGMASKASKNQQAARVAYKLAATTLLSSETPYYAAKSWYRYGFSCFESGEVDEAERSFFRCLSIVAQHNLKASKGIQSLLALTALSRGETDLAIDILNTSLAWVTQQGQIHHAAEDHWLLGLAHQLSGKTEKAGYHYLKSLRIAELLRRNKDYFITRALLAAVKADLGEFLEAKQWMALATERTDLPAINLEIIGCCDLLVQYLCDPSTAHREQAQNWLAEQGDGPPPDTRLGWVRTLLEVALSGSS